MLDWDRKPQDAVHGETWIVFNALLGIVLLPVRLVLAVLGVTSWQAVVQPFVAVGATILEAKGTIRIVGALLTAFIVQLIAPPAVVDAFVMESTDIVNGVVYTVVTSSFLHGSVGHLLSNIAALLVFGRVVERYFGETGLYVVYATGVIIGGATTQLIRATQPEAWAAIGASIGVSTLIGIAVLRSPLYITYLSPIPGPIALIGALYVWQEAANIFAADGVSHLGHLMGFVTAVGLAFYTGGFARTWTRIGLAVLVILVCVTVIGFALNAFL